MQLRPELADAAAAALKEDEQFDILQDVYKRKHVGKALAWDATSMGLMANVKWKIDPPSRAEALRKKLGLGAERPPEEESPAKRAKKGKQ